MDIQGAVILGIDALLLGAILLWPLSRRFDTSDHGSGSRVRLPAPRPPSLLQTGVFVAICAITASVLIGLRNPSPMEVYRNAVAMVTSSVVHQPGIAATYTSHLIPVVPISVIAYIVSLSVALPASPGRRLMILLHAPLFLAASITADGILGVIGITSGIPLGPTPLISIMLHYGIGFLLVLRLAFTSYQLPRRSPLPMLRTRRSDLADDLLVIIALITSFAAVGALGVFLMGEVGDNTLLRLLVLLAIPSYALYGSFCVLGFFRLLGDRLPRVTEQRPPVEVIIPAFNEEANIERILASIDAAARVYQGPVRIILCDDGSTDDTRELAAKAMRAFTAAHGEIINGVHGGKSSALNQALAVCRADYVVRLDADCVMGEQALLYTVPWFLTYPDIGLVGAMTLPKRPYTTWIDRMRSFEMVLPFGFTRLCKAAVDGIPCVPGTYVAFRREAALAVGGNIEGLFGEDYDFTCALARLGYRAAIDRRIRSFEDVPANVKQLRVQRVRWGRGGSQVFARYTPFTRHPGGPRFWFFGLLAAGKRLSGPLHTAGFIYLMDLTVFDATYRQNQAHYWVLFSIALLPRLLLKLIPVIYYGEARILAWTPLLLPFALLKRLFQLESVLTFPTRPVLRRRYEEPEWVTQARTQRPAMSGAALAAPLRGE